MSFLRKIASLIRGGESTETEDVHWEYIRCSRCKEQIPVRVDLRNELTPQYEDGEGAYYVRKGIVGSGRTRCFRTIEVELFFNSDRQLVSRYITGGEFITKDEFYAQEVSDE
jgi:Fe-S oxidoreductase